MPIEISRQDVAVDKVRDMAHEKKLAGCRLIQICGLKIDGALELLYSFDNKGALEMVYVKVGDDKTEVESISDLFAFAFLYENEVKELFGINMVNIPLDFGGNLYQTKQKRVFNPVDGGEQVGQ